MPDPTERTEPPERLKRLLSLGLLLLLGFLLYVVVAPFLAALAWSVIITLSLWPLFRALKGRFPDSSRLPPLLMSAGLLVGVLVPLVFLGLLLIGEAERLGHDIHAGLIGEKGDLAGMLGSLPMGGEALREGLLRWRADPSALGAVLQSNREGLLSLATKTLGDVTRNTFKIIVCLFATYFLFRHGEGLGAQISRASFRIGGLKMHNLLARIRSTVRATVYGLLVTALVQAVLAAFGFWIAGVPFPLLLGALMFLFSFIPFGPPIIWLPAAVGVLTEGRIGWGIFLLIWGGGVVSTMDNILRPIFIGKAASMPVLLVFLGVIGGLMAFGMVGLFLGPVVIAVALALWEDWVSQGRGATGQFLRPLLSDAGLLSEGPPDREGEEEP
ncbi:MAG TPA: AI-2E family transporter [Planctomycetota bacterium]|nr:AI-2E family transporter [Planctomycetota bacterium]